MENEEEPEPVMNSTIQSLLHTCRNALLFASLAAALMALTTVLRAENWAHWRGPLFNGSTPENDFPVTFSKEENVVWSAPMPGPAAATPIIWGKYVLISTVDQSNKTLLALCLERSNGKVLWQKEIASGISKDERSNFASGSPTTDGTLAYFYY